MNVDHPLYWTHILCRVDRGQQADDPPKTDDRMNVDERILCVEWTVEQAEDPPNPPAIVRPPGLVPLLPTSRPPQACFWGG